jgi:coproporphyrinogen III oxidase
MTKEEISEYFQNLQHSITTALEQADGAAVFVQDLWQRPEGGGGRTRTIANGHIIEKGGVGYSAVHGALHPKMQEQLGITADVDFYATGVSLVIHPHSPMVPIVHMNVRYFELSNGMYWFGGGIDLSPHYVVETDAAWFHAKLKSVCDQAHSSFYPKFKTWADEYFYLPHRNETRGVGGIFFDHLNEQSYGMPKPQLFEFVKNLGQQFVPIYTHYMAQNAKLPFAQNEKNWQMLRRSRYVEFNLLYDRGTKFGLDSNGRTESILMSMPPMAQWQYNYNPQPNSPEAHTQTMLKKGVDWLQYH